MALSVGNATPGTLGGAVDSTGSTTNLGVVGSSGLGTQQAGNIDPNLVGGTTGGGGVLGANTGGSGNYSYGGYDPAAAAASAKAAADAAKASSTRQAITGLAHSIFNVYDSLYGNIDTAGADQGRLVNQKYDTEGKGILDQFNQDFPAIGDSYAARGAYDSSYRTDAEGNAQNALQNAQDQIGQGRQADLGKVGQFIASNKAGIEGNKQGINAILAQIDGETDVNNLTQLQNSIQQKLIDAQSSQSGLGTQGSYAQQVQSLVPTADQTANLQGGLHSILQSQANPLLKKSIGVKQIQTSGLPDSQKAQLIAEFSAAVDQSQQPLPSQG